VLYVLCGGTSVNECYMYFVGVLLLMSVICTLWGTSVNGCYMYFVGVLLLMSVICTLWGYFC
jgi:hypothetical protein